MKLTRLEFSGATAYILDTGALALPHRQVWLPGYHTSVLFSGETRQPSVTATLTRGTPAHSDRPMALVGAADNGLIFSNRFIFPAGKDTCVVSELTTTASFDETFDFIASIEWRAIDFGAVHPLGTTDNNIYYVPVAPKEPELRDTVLYVVCRRLKGLPYGHRDALARIWKEFERLHVVCANRRALLHYWRSDADIRRSSVAELLRHRSGNCQAWALFFRDSLALAGCRGVKMRRLVARDARRGHEGDYSLKMKHLVFLTRGHDYGHAPYNFKYGTDWKFDWRIDAETPAIGAQGESVKRGFTMHYITKVGRTYFDPSYGVRAADLAALEDKILGGIEKQFGEDGFLLRANTAQEELRDTRP